MNERNRGTALELIRARIAEIERQQDSISARINSNAKIADFDLGMLAERRGALGVERIRLEILQELIDGGEYCRDVETLFVGRCAG